jgi:hypothetical protein
MRQPLAEARGKSMLAHSAMSVVFVLVQSIKPGTRKGNGGSTPKDLSMVQTHNVSQ